MSPSELTPDEVIMVTYVDALEQELEDAGLQDSVARIREEMDYLAMNLSAFQAAFDGRVDH